MDQITSKVQIREIVAAAKQQGQQSSIECLILSLQECLLKKKVRFPLLEFAAREIMLPWAINGTSVISSANVPIK